MERKLKIELVPDSCWCSNLRSILSKKQWDFIKKDAKQRANGKCSICGKPSTSLDAHEDWEYNEETNTQILKDVKAICKDCHSVIHIGFTSLKGNLERAEKHYQKVNGCTYAEFIKDLGDANIDHQRRNKVNEWKLDLSWLERFIND